MGEETFGEKAAEFFGRVAAGVENGIKAVVSKRIYIIAALVYIGLNDLTDAKFCALCAVGIAFIWSETARKK